MVHWSGGVILTEMYFYDHDDDELFLGIKKEKKTFFCDCFFFFVFCVAFVVEVIVQRGDRMG